MPIVDVALPVIVFLAMVAVGLDLTPAHFARVGQQPALVGAGVLAPAVLLPVLAMSLGAGETTLAKLAAGYAAFVNGGKQVKYTLIDRIQDRWGHTIWTYDDRKCTADCNADKWEGQAEPTLPPDTKKQIIDPHTAYQVTSMMEGVVQRGTGTVIRRILGANVPVAGKTGTTNDEKDAWFVGYSPHIACAVWTGFDDATPLGAGETGAITSLPAFVAFMQRAHANKSRVAFAAPPAGVVRAYIDPSSGKLAASSQGAVEEVFLAGTEPSETAEPALPRLWPF